MFFILFKKELQQSLRTARFTVAMAIVVAAFFASALLCSASYHNQLAEYNRHQAEEHRQLEDTMQNLSQVAFHLQSIQIPPSPYSFMADPTTTGAPNSVGVDVCHHTDMSRIGSVNPFLAGYEKFTWMLIISAIGGFIAILLSYDGVVGERQFGTLALVRSHSVKAWQLITAKLAAISTINAILLALGIVLSLAVMSILGVPVLDPDTLGMVSCFFVIAMAFLTFVTSVGLLVSCLAPSASLSLTVLLFLWVVFALVLPSSARITAFMIKEVPTPLEKDRIIRTTTRPIFVDAFSNRPLVNGSRIVSYGRIPMGPIEEHVTRCNLRYENVRRQLQADFDRQVFEQTTFALDLARFSPVELFRQGVVELSDGGLNRIGRFLEVVEGYRVTLGEALKGIDQRDPNSGHVYFSNVETPLWISQLPVDDPGLIPRFAMPEIKLWDRVGASLAPAGILLLCLLIAFVTTVFVFTRLDVRQQ